MTSCEICLVAISSDLLDEQLQSNRRWYSFVQQSVWVKFFIL